jgi:hypothetical protein
MPFSDEEQIIVTERPKLTNTVLLVGAGLFFISLLTNAFCTDKSCRPSYEAFLVGWMVMLGGGAGVSWLANPLLVASWILLDKNRKTAWLFACLAVIFCLSFLSFERVLENEAGHYGLIKSIGTGYWLWTSSSIVTFLGCLYIRLYGMTRKVM